MTQEFEKIIIGGVETEIRSYESVVEILKNRYGFVLSTKEYLSALFNNLGYRMRPKNFDFIDKQIPIEDIELTNIVDIRHNVPELYTFYYNDNLYNILKVIKFWCKGKVHGGFILSTENTYKDSVTDAEVMWNMQNGFDIKRPAIVTEKIQYWNGSDIKTTRLYGINPSVNENYYDHHIKEFESLSKKITVEDPWLLFIMAVVEPDSIMSLIRRVEIETVERTGYNHGNHDINLISDFQAVMRCYVNQIYNIFCFHHMKGLVKFAISINRTKNISRQLAQELYSGYTVPTNALNAAREDQTFIDTFSMLTLEQKKMYVADLDLNNKERNINSIIARYVDISSLNKIFKNHSIENHGMYINVMKNLYILISQINIYIPNYISFLNEKMVLSKNLFIDQNNFALFNKFYDNFILIDDNYNICMCDIDKVSKFIKDKYGKDVRLVPKEDMGNKRLERDIPDLVFEYDEIMKQEEISHQVPVYTDIFRIDEIKKEDESYGLEGLIVE